MAYPVLISVYDRFSHLKKCIYSLQQNKLAKETELFIASDAGKNIESETRVTEIREYVKKISGFKNINLLEWDTNIGQANSTKRAKDIIFQKYDAYIFLEDDNIVSPHFLSFMNYNLNKWKNNPQILFVCGYMYPIKIDYKYDNILLKEFNAWGYGVWKEKFIDASNLDRDYFLERPESIIQLKKYSHASYYILKSDLIFNKAYGDGRRAFLVVDQDAFSVFPIKSLVKNIGQDGSGLHSGKNKKLQAIKLDCEFKPSNYMDDIYWDDSIQRKVTKYRHYNIFKRIRIHLGRYYHIMNNNFKVNKNV